MAEEEQNIPDVDKISEELAVFIERNPDTKIELSEAKEKRALIKNPWADPSVAIVVPLDEKEKGNLVDCLNNITMPSRLSAIYHVDRKEIEVIFTARALSDSMKELDGRKFDFTFKDKVIECHFTDSSDRLMAIAKRVVFPQHSETSFRNLMSFVDFSRLDPEDGSEYGKFMRSQLGRPLSFFVRGVEWDEEETLNILRHISFYLLYYDSLSPFVRIHPPEDQTQVNPKERYVDGAFPFAISSRQLNPALLSFYLAAADAHPENNFLYCYRIIEFVASHYLKHEKLREVKRVLSNPALLSSLDTSIDVLVGLIRDEKGDVVRFRSVVQELTRKEVVWPEICKNPDAFTKVVMFDGGFELAKLVDAVDTIDRLSPNCLQAMAGIFRNIRHALAHGGEEQAGKVILPTARNAKLLQPWVHLIVAVAGEVILHENHT